VDIQLGHTLLMLAPPHWYRLRSTPLVVDFEVSAVIDLALAYAGTPIIRRLVVRNWHARLSPPASLQIVFPGFAPPETIAIPILEPGQSLNLTVPLMRFDYNAFAHRVEKSLAHVTVTLSNGATQRAPIWVLEANI
jgi:hypothetical protein